MDSVTTPTQNTNDIRRVYTVNNNENKLTAKSMLKFNQYLNEASKQSVNLFNKWRAWVDANANSSAWGVATDSNGNDRYCYVGRLFTNGHTKSQFANSSFCIAVFEDNPQDAFYFWLKDNQSKQWVGRKYQQNIDLIARPNNGQWLDKTTNIIKLNKRGIDKLLNSWDENNE